MLLLSTLFVLFPYFCYLCFCESTRIYIYIYIYNTYIVIHIMCVCIYIYIFVCIDLIDTVLIQYNTSIIMVRIERVIRLDVRRGKGK